MPTAPNVDYQALFEAAPGLYRVLVPDAPRYTIVAASNAYLAATKTRREAIVGRGLFEMFPDDSDASASLVRVVSKRVPDVTALVVSSPVFGPDGDVAWIIQDMSRHEPLVQELIAANVFLDAIIENIPLMLFIKESTSLRFVRFNRAGEDLLGWPRQTLIGRNDFDFWPQKQAEFFIEKDRETMRAGKVIDIDEEPIQTRHRGVRVLHTKKVPILDPAGSARYLLGISEDITERKQVETERRLLAEADVALSASLDFEQTLTTVTRLAVQHVADWCAIDLIGPDGLLARSRVVSANAKDAALCKILERMPPYRELPHLAKSALEDRHPIVIEHITQQYLESVAQSPEHLQALQATGVTSFIAVPLVMRKEPLGVLLFASNDRAFSRDDLRWAEALAGRAAVAIENARLYRASIEAAQRRDQVLGVVAHDLRNPLSTILMQIKVLSDDAAQDQKPIAVIHRAAVRMNRLIEDLLDVTLIDARQLPIKKVALTTRELLMEAVESQKDVATASSLELRLVIESNTPREVFCDRDRLLQVFENLIGNAIKFTPSGGCITVGAASKDGGIVFSVTDTGCGIASEVLPQVFDRFWQATRGDRRGAGLGLPIIKGIVEAHGGRVWVESTLGRGTSFFFSIPPMVRP